MRAGGEGDNRRWDGWMASPTQWTWVWAGSRRWWRTGKPGVLQSVGSQRVRHDLATEQQQHQSPCIIHFPPNVILLAQNPLEDASLRVVIMSPEAPLDSNSFSACPCFWWPRQIWGLLHKYFCSTSLHWGFSDVLPMIRSGLWVSWERPQRWCAVIICYLLSLWLLTVDSTLNTWRSLALSNFFLLFFPFPHSWPGGLLVKNLLPVQEAEAQCLSQEDPLEEEIATHSSILAWNIPWTQERGGLQSMGLQRVGNDWAHIHSSLWWNVKWAHFCGVFYSFIFYWSL